MKRMFVGLIAASVFLLSACGVDDGELAGEWKGDKGNKWIISYNKDDGDYAQKIFMIYPNGSEIEAANNSHLKRNENWLGDEDNGPGREKYFIKVIDKNTLQFRNDEKDIYRRVQ